jgi:hypothetical protein
VFPQPPFELSPEARYPNLVLVSNPSTFRINGISFGVVTNDVLRHLAGMSVTQKESDKTTDGRERVAQLTAHVIEQQRFYSEMLTILLMGEVLTLVFTATIHYTRPLQVPRAKSTWTLAIGSSVAFHTRLT